MQNVYKPTRLINSVLFRTGELVLNSNSVVPDSYLDAVWNHYAPDAYADVGEEEFKHPDSVTTLLSGYDEVVIDILPRVSSTGLVTTNYSTETYRKISNYERPCWFVVRCDSYGIDTLLTADKALQVALAVIDSIWADALNYQITKHIAGFAILQPNLNVVFPDLSTITRLFQSRLVQQAHYYERPCMVITTRPDDITTTVGQEIAGNSNSKQPLQFSILGNNPVYRDKLIALYPHTLFANVSVNANVSSILGAFSSFRGVVKQERTGKNLDFGMLFQIDSSNFTLDTASGLKSGNDEIWARVKEIVAFTASLGITNIGFQATNSNFVMHPSLWAPKSANTSGSWSQVYSSDGVVSVEYAASDGTPVTRNFTKDLIELGA